MLHTTNVRIITIRDIFNKIRRLINFMVIALVCLSIIYFVYWTAVMSDDMILEYSANYFNLLAGLLFPNDSSVDIYR